MEIRRRELILKYIVELFVKTAIPVGSNTLLDNFHLPYSSATIRAEMNALEATGFLEKTHTSSGRVPSTKGYQYYVNHLRDYQVDNNIKYQIQTLIEKQSKSIEEVVSESVKILADMTNLTSVIIGPSSSDDKLASVQLIPLSKNSATAIFVTDRGYVENKTFIIPPTTSIDEVGKVVTIFNDRLKGTKISQVIEKMDSLRPMLQEYVIEQEVIHKAFMQAFVRYAKDRLELYGKESLLTQPEFVNDPSKLRKLITILDDPEKIRQLITKEGELTIEIGDGDNELSIITSSIKVPGRTDGRIVLMGPKRMDYDTVVNALEYVTDALEQYFEKESRLDDE